MRVEERVFRYDAVTDVSFVDRPNSSSASEVLEVVIALSPFVNEVDGILFHVRHSLNKPSARTLSDRTPCSVIFIDT